MLLWLAVIATAIAPALARHRARSSGLLIGTALAVSLKTLLLLATAGIAWLTVLAIDACSALLRIEERFARDRSGSVCWRARRAGRFRARSSRAPVHGARRSTASSRTTSRRSSAIASAALRVLLPLLGYPLAVAVGVVWRKHAHDRARWRAQCGVLLSTLLYLLVLYGCWPLVTHQDLSAGDSARCGRRRRAVLPRQRDGAGGSRLGRFVRGDLLRQSRDGRGADAQRARR